MKEISLIENWIVKNERDEKKETVSLPFLCVNEQACGEHFKNLLPEKNANAVLLDSDAFSVEKVINLSKKELENEHAVLHFDCLDTLCSVFVNNERVADCNNIHLQYDFEIKDLLIEGQNIIMVKFKSLFKYIEERQRLYPLPANANGIQHSPHVRKTACHFGWDFAPSICPQGIPKSAQLKLYSHPIITDLSVKQKIVSGRAKIFVEAEVSEPCSVIFSVKSPDMVTTKLIADSSYSATFEIESPELWECREHGEQPLYIVKATVISESGLALHKVKKRIGLRTIRLNRDKDLYGNDFQFFVNDKPIFAKGANFVPSHLLCAAYDKERLRELLTMCKNANMNMIRVWGGGTYESEDFYNLCDEMGLLVWQDCAFACSAYPFELEDYTENCLKEIEQNVKRIKHHPSLCLWCGNNEIESMSMAWLNRRSIIKETEKFFYEALPSLINRIDGDTPYHACSPSSGQYMKEMCSDKNGDSHIWNTWHGYQYKQYLEKRFPRFCSEFGMQSYPSSGTRANQYCPLGEERIEYYLTHHFTLAKTRNDKRYLTGLMQLEYMKTGTEHFRNHQDRCHGSLFWQLNDCWQAASWSAVDVRNQKKPLMYASKGFFESIHISAQAEKDTVKIYVCNEKENSFKGKIICRFEKLSGKSENRAEKNIFIAPFCAECMMNIQLTGINRRDSVLVMELFSEDNELQSENRLILCENNELLLIDPQLTIDTVLRAGKVFATVKAGFYARYIELSAGEQACDFSDNYFDLCAGEEKTVEIKNPCAGLSDYLTVRSLYDVLKYRSSAKDTLRHIQLATKPAAIANKVSRMFEK